MILAFLLCKLLMSYVKKEQPLKKKEAHSLVDSCFLSNKKKFLLEGCCIRKKHSTSFFF